MTNETEKKILDAALNVFAKKGKDAATTKAIAEQAGRTEMTLFRKFGTKKNLFDMVMIQNMKKLQTDMETIVSDLDYKSDAPDVFLENYIRRIVQFYKNNIEAITLLINDDNSTVDSLMGDINNYVSEFIARNLPEDTNIDPKTLTIFINTYVYSLTLEVFNGRDIQFNEKIDGMINNIALCF